MHTRHLGLGIAIGIFAAFFVVTVFGCFLLRRWQRRQKHQQHITTELSTIIATMHKTQHATAKRRPPLPPRRRMKPKIFTGTTETRRASAAPTSTSSAPTTGWLSDDTNTVVDADSTANTRTLHRGTAGSGLSSPDHFAAQHGNLKGIAGRQRRHHQRRNFQSRSGSFAHRYGDDALHFPADAATDVSNTQSHRGHGRLLNAVTDQFHRVKARIKRRRYSKKVKRKNGKSYAPAGLSSPSTKSQSPADDTDDAIYFAKKFARDVGDESSSDEEEQGGSGGVPPLFTFNAGNHGQIAAAIAARAGDTQLLPLPVVHEGAIVDADGGGISNDTNEGASAAQLQVEAGNDENGDCGNDDDKTRAA
jgi:hypothetical protein